MSKELSIHLLEFFALLSSFFVVLSPKVERSVLGMISMFILTSILFLTIGISYVGIVYLIVYNAAMSIVFIIVIMLIGIKE